MKPYKKPTVTAFNGGKGFVPALVASAAAIAEMSAASAFAVGVAAGLMKGDRNFTPRHIALKKV